MSCVMCDSDPVQLRPTVDVLVVPYIRSVRVARYAAQQSMLPEDDCMIETCRSVLSILM